ncbi:LysR family transcriptional regulator [Martelella alba]|uniref:LysR family transcriptional regulator n=1 Tax=Martelella alba TaxID=2590451 RepID=A0ABY2SF26_9HYPH|nr:LysR family transcriptional regulator [Martelella alba]TKI03484.1 LysR family transcriptional regulator [Martelella alba]
MTESDLNLLIALDVLLAEGSVAGAARRLGLSASAMSRALGRLRAATGDPLLVRAGRQMVLTPHAERVAERARNALFEARAVLRPAIADANPAALERTFTLRANEGFTVAFGAALIAAASDAAPRVRLCFIPKPDKTSRYLREGLVDLDVGVLGEMGPEIRLQALFRDRFVGLVRQGHPLTRESQITAERYVAFGHVVVSRRGQLVGPVDNALAERGLRRNIAAVVPSFPAALAVAQGSDLVALVPASFLINQPVNQPAAESGDTAGAVFSFALPVKTDDITVSQMWHPRVDADPAHRWLRQLVLNVCRRLAPA